MITPALLEVHTRRQTNLRARICGALTALTLLLCGRAVAANEKDRVVRLAKLRIDAAQLESYQAALKEEIETSVRVEPGVLSLSAVAEKADPTRITILEVYADTQAYEAHLQTPHFKKYKLTTREMVRSLELVETVPVVLAAKAK